MQKIWKLLLVCLVTVSAMSLNSCKDDEQKSQEEKLIERWQAVKIVADGVDFTKPEILSFIYFEFNDDGTCVFNTDDDEDFKINATFSYKDGLITLSNVNNSGISIICKVLELTDNKLVLQFPAEHFEVEESFVIHYEKVKK